MRKKAFCRCIVLLFCLVFFLVGLTACGVRDKADKGGETDNGREDNASEYDFGGYEFVFLTHPADLNTSTYSGPYLVSDGSTQNVLLDSVYQRNKMIEEELNVEFMTWLVVDVKANVRSLVLSGEGKGDVILAKGTDLAVLAREGLLADLNTFEQFDMSKEYWDSNAEEQLSVGGKLYFTNCDINNYELGNVLYFNKTLIKDKGLPTPHEYMKLDEWTLDNWAATVSAIGGDLNGDGDMTELDRYGTLYGGENELMFMRGAGVGTYLRGEDGYYRMASENADRAKTVYEKLKAVFTSGNSWNMDGMSDKDTHGYYSKYDYARSLFGQDLYAFCYTETNEMHSINHSDIEFGIAPFPKLDKGQEKYYSLYPSDTFLVAVPAGMDKDESERTGIVLEKLNYYSNILVTPAWFETLLQRKYIGDGKYEKYDEESAESIEIIYNSRVYDVPEMFGLYGMIGERYGNVEITPPYYARVADMLQKELDSVNEQLKQNRQ